MYDRRNFIKLTSLAAVGGLALRGDLAVFGSTVGTLPQNLQLSNPETFEPLLNTNFFIKGNGLRASSIRLVDVVKRNLKKSSTNRFPTEGFTLVFENDGKGKLEDKIHEVSHPQLGTFSMFVSTVDRSGKSYQAVFCRVQS